ncbi:SH3 domain-containing protein, partial [Deltaproteobacteria bacterium TL4]
MKNFIILLMAVAFLISAIPGKDKEIKRPGVKLREGEGNFYNIVVSLNVGDKVSAVEEKADWTKVKTSAGKEGWVANNAFIEAKINDSFKMASLDIKNKLSSIDATASIRGVT